MMKFTDLLNILYSDAVEALEQLVEKHGKESEYSSTMCLQINDRNLNFVLDDARFLSEISASELIDDQGYTYHFTVLDYDQFFKVVDYLKDKYNEN